MVTANNKQQEAPGGSMDAVGCVVCLKKFPGKSKLGNTIRLKSEYQETWGYVCGECVRLQDTALDVFLHDIVWKSFIEGKRKMVRDAKWREATK